VEIDKGFGEGKKGEGERGKNSKAPQPTVAGLYYF